MRNKTKAKPKTETHESRTSIGWDLGEAVESSCITSCAELESEHTIGISFGARQKIQELVAAYPNLEWAAGLIGRHEENKWIVDDIFVPEQEVHSCTVELTDEGNRELAKTKCIGWMHSHNSMAAFHSPKDDNNSKMFDVSVTVNNKLETDARVKVHLPCGKFGMAKAAVVFEVPVAKGSAFVDSIRDKIKEVKWDKYATVPYGHGYARYDAFGRQVSAEWTCGVCLQQLSHRAGKTAVCRICGGSMHKVCMSETPDVCQECDDRKGTASGRSEWEENGVEWELNGYA
jgi:proteasome lid subunit RPN8/RPN11